MSNLYRYLLPKTGGGWLRRYYQHKKLLVSMEFQSSDAVPMLPIPIFDFTRDIDAADASTISSTTVDGWTVSDDGVINGSSTSHALLIRTTQCWQHHLQITNQRMKQSSTIIPTQQQQQQQNSSTEHVQIPPQAQPQENDTIIKGDAYDDNDSIQLLSRPYIRWYGNLNTNIGLESKVQRSGFCAIRSPIFPFDGASLQGLYSFLEITCRYIPVEKHHSDTIQKSSTRNSNNNHNNSNETGRSLINSKLQPNHHQQQQQPQSGPARIFTLNLRVTSALNDDIYQGHLSLDHPIVSIPIPLDNEEFDSNNNRISNQQDQQQEHPLPPFRTFVIPFDELLLTARGREREYQRRLMGSVDIESIGFLLMDNIEGPFQFDIAKIRAVNCLEDDTRRSTTVYESPSQFLRTTDTTTSTPPPPPTTTTANPSSSDVEVGEIPEDKQQLKILEHGITIR